MIVIPSVSGVTRQFQGCIVDLRWRAEGGGREALVGGILCAFVALIGGTVLLGWIVGATPLETVLPGLTTMKVNTAAGLLMASVGLGVQQRRRGGTGEHGLALVLGAVVAGLGAATLAEYLFGVQLGIDELIIADPATTSAPFNGRMSPATAVGLIAIGGATLLLAGGRRTTTRAAHWLGLLPALVGILSLTGYAYGVEKLYNFGPYLSVAVNTDVSLCALTVVILLTRADQGWRRSIVGRPTARAVLLQLLPWAVVAPFVLGFVVLEGARFGFYQALYAPALFSVLTTVLFVWLSFKATEGARRAETALAESEEQFRAFAQAMPNHVWASNAAGRLTWLNQAAFTYTGGTLEAHTGERWIEAVHPEDAPVAAKAWAAALASETPYEAEFRIRAADGNYRWFLVRGQPIRGQDGAVQQWIGANTDTHEQKRLFAELERFSATLEQRIDERTQERDRLWEVSLDMLGMADRALNWLSVNPAWSRILGWPTNAFLGRSFTWLLRPEDRARAATAVARLATHGATAFEGHFRTQGGGERLLSWTIVSSEGRTYGTARDITAEHQRETAMRDMEDFTRLALSSVGGVGVWTLDTTSDRFFCDDAIIALYGLDPERKAEGYPSADFLANVDGEDLRTLRTTMAEGMKRGGDVELEYRIRHPDGTLRWVLSRGHTHLDEAGHPIRRTGIGIDTTRQRELEEQLRQSQKMEAVGQLTGGVAHDFNNLLTVIRSSTDLLKRPDLPADRHARYVAAISDTVDRAAKLTGQLLAFARRQALKPEVFEVGASVRGIGDMLDTLVGSRITVVTEGPDEPCFAAADTSQFETALVNMVVNARDAMDGQGRLTVSVAAERAMPALRGHAAVTGDFVAVSIADTGMGIPAEHVERIFEPFFTTKSVGHGTGLGLSQVFGFAKQSGGEIGVRSEVGQGTVFTLYLPRVAARGPASAEPRDQEPLVEGQGTCVLVVEDNAPVGAFATQTLSELGYETVLAVNADAALKALAADPERFDVVFSDVIMPGMNGIEFGRYLHAHYPHLSVVLTSGYSHILAQNGTDGFDLLQKPYSIEQLSQALRTAAGARRRRATLDPTPA